MAGKKEVMINTQPEATSIPKLVTGYLIKFIENNNFEALFVIGLLFIAAFYGIFVFGKNILGYRLSKEDLKAKRLKNIASLHTAQDTHNEMAEMYNLSILQFITALHDGAIVEELCNLREQAISFYTQKYLPSLEKYLDIFEIFYRRKHVRRHFVRTVIRKEMQMAIDFRNTVNSETILAILGRSSLPLDQASYDRVWRFWSSSLSLYTYKLRSELKQKKNEWSSSIE